MSAKEQIYELFLDGTLGNKTIDEILKILKIQKRDEKTSQ